MHRLNLLFIGILLVSAVVPLSSAAESMVSGGCVISDASPLSDMTWLSSAPPGSPGGGLLQGAKALMKGIYTYTGGPDYLPVSYTNQNNQSTNYVIHAKDENLVSWAPNQSNQLQWISEPGGFPKGWSGKVAFAGLSQNITPLSCNTDCSGFITSLFTYANSVSSSKYTSWMAGNAIPEAGCNDPSGACEKPNPLNYYQLFISGKNGWFTSVPLNDLQPGDIIAYANTKNHSDSGHIMLVTAVASCPSDPASKFVIIIDETGDEHSFDTRPVKTIGPREKTGAGVGMGVIRLSDEKKSIKFYWSLTSTSPQVGEVALGRAL